MTIWKIGHVNLHDSGRPTYFSDVCGGSGDGSGGRDDLDSTACGVHCDEVAILL